MTIVEMSNLSKWYGEVIGLNNITGSIEDGITGLVGPNGAGKSTMMGLLTGQLLPSKGHLRVLGENPWNNPRLLTQIGFCPEGDPLWFRLSGCQFVTFLARLSGMSRRGAKIAAARSIERVALTEHQHRPMRTYSKGMRQRIKIAQALSHNPGLLVLDEPFTGADPVVRKNLADLFHELADQGTHVIIASHVLHEVESITNQILLINHGRIVAGGQLKDIREEIRDKPQAVRVVLEEPRVLAARLCTRDWVTSLRFEDRRTLIAETSHPEKIYEEIEELVLSEGLAVVEVGAEDVNLEAIFGYLTDGGD